MVELRLSTTRAAGFIGVEGIQVTDRFSSEGFGDGCFSVEDGFRVYIGSPARFWPPHLVCVLPSWVNLRHLRYIQANRVSSSGLFDIFG
ncbi:hypothetical protein Hanom_Chr07g00602631 [Helianthus anomalus]